MLIDHIAVVFLMPTSLAYFVFRTIGKTTIPIICYLIAEGCFRTRNVKKYALRLLGFALLSQFPFAWVWNRALPTSLGEITAHGNVLFTLFFGLTLLSVWLKWDETKLLKHLKAFKLPFVVFICVICLWSDWAFVAPLWVLCFGVFRDSKFKQMMSYCAVSVFYIFICFYLADEITASLFTLLGLASGIFFISAHDRELDTVVKDKSSVFTKWFFYAFYPVHLLVLALIGL